MRVLFILGIYLAISCSQIDAQFRTGRRLVPQYADLDGIETHHVNQVLDHFDNISAVTHWKQRYYVSDTYWKKDGPIFLMIGGEGEVIPNDLAGGIWVDWAQKYGALLLELEHRYYGKSMPTSDASTDNLKKYLSSRQALADISYFIDYINESYKLTSANKWIVFGGSYPGNLVAWSRLLYPDKIYGGISSSGPLRAEVDFYQYYDVVASSLDKYYPGCGKQATKAVGKVKQLLQTASGVKKLNSKVKICYGFDRFNEFDRSYIVTGLTGGIADAVQYNKQNPDNGISTVCRYMLDSSMKDPLDRLIKYYNVQSNYSCVSGNYNANIRYMKTDSLDSNAVKRGDRTWTFQTCNEFGYYQTSETKKSFLLDTVPLNLSLQTCTDIFGKDFNPTQLDNAVKATNDYYQGENINVTRVVFIQGTVDPWHALGQVKNPTPESPYYLVEGTSHCYDMLSPRFDDPAELTAARNAADEKIGEWISQ